jgi:serine/threonine-protein kinase
MTSVQQLYADLSAGNTEAARQRFSAEAADQFDPTYFAQFARVEVGDLVETDRRGSLVGLTGIVTLIYPDGTTQREARLFSVDTASDPPRVTASSFDRVVSPRQ